MTLEGAALGRCRSCGDPTLIPPGSRRCFGCAPSAPAEYSRDESTQALPEPEPDPQSAIDELFVEAQEAIPIRSSLGFLLSASGSMHIAWAPISSSARRVLAAKPPRLLTTFPGALSCLLCGQLPQEYGSCRCVGCNRRRRSKRRGVTAPQHPRTSPP